MGLRTTAEPESTQIAELQAGADTSYGVGVDCTWHDFLARSGYLKPLPPGNSARPRCCPVCGGELRVVPAAADFWDGVREADRGSAGYEKLLRWSQGKCYQDYDTLQNAHRQAMEE